MNYEDLLEHVSEHTHHGETLTLVQALDEIAAAANVDALGELVATHSAALPDHRTEIVSAGMERSRALLAQHDGAGDE